MKLGEHQSRQIDTEMPEQGGRMKLHELKSAPKHFDKYSHDTWSLRLNDRNFQKGDLVIVYHINEPNMRHLHGIEKVNSNLPGLENNYVILNLKLFQEFI